MDAIFEEAEDSFSFQKEEFEFFLITKRNGTILFSKFLRTISKQQENKIQKEIKKFILDDIEV